MELEFEIDKITESIESAETGERFDTHVLPLGEADLRGVTPQNGWLFNWKSELAETNRQVYKLVTEKEQNVIQGLLSFEKNDKEKLIFIYLIENAPHNLGRRKAYKGVCGNLVAYACKKSKEYGFNGYVSFMAKTALIEHYMTMLKAKHYGGQRMGIEPDDADLLINNYFPQA